jgi:soluble lytic murein transglycosylase
MGRRILLVIFITLAAIAAIIGVVFLRDYILRQQFPLEYEDLIVKYSNAYNLDPYFVAALIDTESDFNDKAVSKDGAQGLMQIMPDTAEWIAQKLDVQDYNMMDPENNIEFGCWYLNFLQDKFSGEEQLMMAAYNAGHNKVEEWLAKGYSKDGATLDEIPYAETKNYVNKVSRAYEQYKKLYEIG